MPVSGQPGLYEGFSMRVLLGGPFELGAALRGSLTYSRASHHSVTIDCAKNGQEQHHHSDDREMAWVWSFASYIS